MGGYLYFHLSPNSEEFDNECRRLLQNISYFDVLRSDKSISSHGLEPRTPFLDKEFVRYYLSIPKDYRYPIHESSNLTCEKAFFRTMIDNYAKDLIPKEILYRRKEAFSDGVSSETKSWYEIIQDYVEENKEEIFDENLEYEDKYNYHNIPKTNEQKYYRLLFENEFPNCGKIIPYFWMPKYINATDASARTLSIYSKQKSRKIAS